MSGIGETSLAVAGLPMPSQGLLFVPLQSEPTSSILKPQSSAGINWRLGRRRGRYRRGNLPAVEQ